MWQATRWALILPAAIVAWYSALLIAVALFQGSEALCPAKYMESGGCHAPWSSLVEEVLVAFGAALAAALVMIACTTLAPAHKREVAIATFAAGTIVAVIMGWNRFLIPMIAAILAGALVLTLLLRRYPSFSLPNKSLERTRER
jgi:hypothetical protein